MPTAFRISKSMYAYDHSGYGASLYGGRWNSKYVPMLYTSSCISLAILEVLANLKSTHHVKDLMLIEYAFPSELMTEVKVKDLPKSWSNFPFDESTRLMGDQFIKNDKFLAMKVPSAIVHQEFNYIINPRIKHIDQLKISSIAEFHVDNRLM
jgi:RES domain-containing protein